MSDANYTYYYNNHFVVTNDVIFFISVAARGEWCVYSKRGLGSVLGGRCNLPSYSEEACAGEWLVLGVGDAGQKVSRLFYSQCFFSLEFCILGFFLTVFSHPVRSLFIHSINIHFVPARFHMLESALVI